jgi:Skp family chaperone for outer membrane proteins
MLPVSVLADPAVSAKLPPVIAAVVDVQRILQESSAAKAVQQQLESQRSRFQAQIESEENELRKAEDELSKSRDQMTPAIYSDREQQLRQRFLKVERNVEERRKILDQVFTDSMNAVRASLLDIVDKVAHEHGANLVIVKQQTLWAEPTLDVTSEVLERLNQKLPKVNVALPPADTP